MHTKFEKEQFGKTQSQEQYHIGMATLMVFQKNKKYKYSRLYQDFLFLLREETA